MLTLKNLITSVAFFDHECIDPVVPLLCYDFPVKFSINTFVCSPCRRDTVTQQPQFDVILLPSLPQPRLLTFRPISCRLPSLTEVNPPPHRRLCICPSQRPPAGSSRSLQLLLSVSVPNRDLTQFFSIKSLPPRVPPF